MKVIRATQQMLETRTLVLGFQGENLRTQLRIDCASTFAEYPNATPALAIKPPTGETYPVFVNRDGTEVVWDIVANNLALKGDGELQLTFYKDNVIAKTSIGHITVNRSLQIDGEMPDVVATWIENANRKLAEVDAQIVELEGMVDTATDAATRAEQSASTASTKAEQAAGSAATATEKATEATNAAGTSTAKAAEAQTAAQTATEKANAAAESERIATAKAGEATTAAGTATTKATEATEAAQTATEKAGEASASATAAHASEINAAESADDALSAEVGANAAKRAAEASATQAAQSAQNAGISAQTATQKATEASQSATDAAASATNAATSAETASTKAGEAAQSAQAVAETAEQLAESLEQIEQNKQDIAELDERKANIDGYYPDMTVGNAEQLNSSKFVENSEPYTLRTSGGSSDIGNREYLDAVVGGTVAWNQAVRDEASENSTDFADIVTVTDAVEDAAGVKVKIESVQDLHGYDHPWPAGGGKNLLHVDSRVSSTVASVTYTSDDDYVYLNGTKYGQGYTTLTQLPISLEPGTYYARAFAVGGTSTNRIYIYANNGNDDIGGDILVSERTFTIVETTTFVFRFLIGTDGTVFSNYKIGIVISKTSGIDVFYPYSNICPITGWDGVKVSRTGKNLLGGLTWGQDIVDAVNYPSNTYLGEDANGKYVEFSAGYVIDSKKITNNLEFKDGVQYSIVLSLARMTDGTSKVTNIVIKYTDNSGYALNFPTDPDTAVKYKLIFKSSLDKTVSHIELGYYSGTTRLYYEESGIFEGNISANDFEPYQGNTYSITLPTEAGTVYGGELTVNADGSGSLVVDRAEVDAGTMNWAKLSSPTFWAVPSGMKLSTLNIISSAFHQNRVGLSQLADYEFTTGAGSGELYVHASAYTDAASFKIAMDGVQLVYELATPITYTLTASQIRTLLGTNNIWADTGDLALTYTGTDEHLTLESGKKYLSRISGTDSMLLGSGQEITAAKGTDNVFDLTQMFGTAVADYVYGQGASFFRRWFPNARYPYNAGELLSVEGLQSHDMVGFNQWDEDWEVGGLVDGAPVTNYSRIRSKNFMPCFGNTAYYKYSGSGLAVNLFWYDEKQAFISYVSATSGMNVTSPANARYFKICTTTTYGGTYKHDICISLAHNGSRNGEYEPYEKHSYPLDSSVILRGIPKVGANGVYWDGDRYLPDGTVERRYGVVDLGTLEWNSATQARFYAVVPGIVNNSSNTINVISTKYNVVAAVSEGNMWVNNGKVYIVDSNYSTAEMFTAAMSGILLVYELATPTTETAQPYHSTQWVSDWGTEEFVSTGLVPVGSETSYPANLRDKLQHLPDAASGNGSYLITQTDGQMVLTPFPAPPSTAGNYVLKATVTNGVATYTWEVAT